MVEGIWEKVGSLWPVISLAGKFLGVLPVFAGTLEFFEEKENRGFTIFYLGPSAGVLIFHYICGSRTVIDNTDFPERLKFRSQ